MKYLVSLPGGRFVTTAHVRRGKDGSRVWYIGNFTMWDVRAGQFTLHRAQAIARRLRGTVVAASTINTADPCLF